MKTKSMIERVLILALVTAAFVAGAAAPSFAERRDAFRGADRNYVFVCLHRAAWRHAPENSIAAINAAIALGADMVELDVKRTKDGHFVLSHDFTVDRVTDGTGAISNLTLAAIQSLHLREAQGGKSAKITAERMPTLEEALDATRGRILVNIDHSWFWFPEVFDIVAARGMGHEIVMKGDWPPAYTREKFGADRWARIQSGEFLYMPILYLRTKNVDAVGRWQTWARVGAPVCEVVFSSDFPGFKPGTGAVGGPRLWVNTMWDDLCAGHTDLVSLKNPAAGWGWVIGHGATVISTDCPEQLIAYLEKTGRHSLGAAVPSAAVSASDVFAPVLLKGRTDRANPVSYAVNDPIVFTLEAMNLAAVPTNDSYFVSWSRSGDDGKAEKGRAPLVVPGATLVLTTSLSRAGFVRLQAFIVDSKDKKIPGTSRDHQNGIFFDGGAGADVASLRPAVPEPADFDAFWARQKAKLAAVPVKAVRTEVPSKNHLVKIYAVTLDCPGPRPVTGYLTVPVAASATNRLPVQAAFQGYGIGVQAVPSSGPWDRIRLEINAHGYELGRDKAYYDKFFDAIHTEKYSYAMDPAQNANPETAYFNGMALRVMRTLQYLEGLPEWNGKDVWVEGGSQGGLQTMWAAALDSRVTKAEPRITWECDVGQFKIGRLQPGWRVPYVPALGYYDAVYFAARVPKSCPVHILRAGLGDYTCPPSGLAVLYNAIPGPKSILWVQGSQHGYVPPAPNQEFTAAAE